MKITIFDIPRGSGKSTKAKELYSKLSNGYLFQHISGRTLNFKREFIGKRFDNLIIDEYPDLNQSLYELLIYLTSTNCKNIFIFGTFDLPNSDDLLLSEVLFENEINEKTIHQILNIPQHIEVEILHSLLDL